MTDLRDRTDLPYRFFKPKNSNRWNMRFSITGFPQIKYALGTSDDDEALALAAEKYQDAAFQARHGILAANGSFRSVAADYVKTLYLIAERNPSKFEAAKRTDAVVKRYFSPFFKTMAITAITHSKLAAYTQWRRVYWTTGPGANQDYEPYERGGKTVHSKAKHEEPKNASLRREDAYLRGVFKHAVGKGLLKPSDVPTQDIPKPKSNKQPAFTKEQYATLYECSLQRLADAQGRPEILYARGMLHHFITLAVETGMRPIELLNLNWKHIEGMDAARSQKPEDRKIIILAYGKAIEASRIVPKGTAYSTLDNIRKTYIWRFKTEPTSETPVFCNIQGGRMTTFNKSLNALLDACNLRTDSNGKKFSSYSFRHSYATWALQDPNVDYMKLSTNMRTSVGMLEKHYSKVIAEDHAAIFRGDHEW
ncbi:tyrosine-type recombinase/integrase [Halocynthiibacter sp.]|uniref:tyrosine-type recombinase/integrase n=1 Tax=Halocynthiibacter sp. TaxID=1979210 RepID=UPI003C37DA6A